MLSDLGPMKQFWLPGGDAGVQKTVGMMEQITAGPKGVGSSLVKSAAMDAVRGTVRDVTEIQGIFQWVKQHIEFRDEAEETLQSPEATLRLGAGDCDDHAMLAAALAGSLGYNWGFKTVAVTRDSPEHYSHVYAVVQDKRSGQWVPMDTTVKNSYAGWEPDDITRSQMYRHKQMGRLGDDSYTDQYTAVPIANPGDTSELTGTQAIAYNLAAPFAQAGALALENAAGVQPSTAALNVSSLLPWLLIGGVVFVIFAASGR
jgi:hypothetical protein